MTYKRRLSPALLKAPRGFPERFFGAKFEEVRRFFTNLVEEKKTKKNFFVICVISVLFVVTFMFGLKLVFLGQKGGKPDEVLLNLVKQSTIVMESNSNCIIIIKIHPPT